MWSVILFALSAIFFLIVVVATVKALHLKTFQKNFGLLVAWVIISVILAVAALFAQHYEQPKWTMNRYMAVLNSQTKPYRLKQTYMNALCLSSAERTFNSNKAWELAARRGYEVAISLAPIDRSGYLTNVLSEFFDQIPNDEPSELCLLRSMVIAQLLEVSTDFETSHYAYNYATDPSQSSVALGQMAQHARSWSDFKAVLEAKLTTPAQKMTICLQLLDSADLPQWNYLCAYMPQRWHPNAKQFQQIQHAHSEYYSKSDLINGVFSNLKEHLTSDQWHYFEQQWVQVDSLQVMLERLNETRDSSLQDQLLTQIIASAQSQEDLLLMSRTDNHLLQTIAATRLERLLQR